MADKKTQKFIPADNPVEQLKDLSGGIAREAFSAPKAILDTAFEQIGLKPHKQPLSGEFTLNNQGGVDKKDLSLDAKLRQLQYVQRQEKEIWSAKQKDTQDQISRLMQSLSLEVKKLESQTAEISADIRKITVENKPAKTGLYYLNFFDQIIAMLKDLRKRVNESRLWLGMSAKKKQQKGYWAMFKKHGTSFAMSEERAIASSNG